DDVHAGDLGLLTAVLRERRRHEWFAMRAKNGTVPFVEPLGRDADLSLRRTSTLDSPAKHLHAVGELALGDDVHRLAILRDAEVGQTCSGDEQAARLGRMIDRRQKSPLLFSFVD